MKVLLRIVIALIVVVMLVGILIPMFFQDEIKDAVISEINNNVNAKVEIDDFSLSLFSSFPNLNASIENIAIINKSPFEGDTLFYANKISADVNLLSAIKGDKIKINSIELINPKVIAFILEDGRNNFNIGIENKEVPNSSAKKENNSSNDEQEKLDVELKSYKITGGKIAFVDQVNKSLLAINNLNHLGEGDFSLDEFNLNTETTIDELTLEQDGIKYLNKTKVESDFNLAVNMKTMSFTFKENEIKLNNLSLNFDGNVRMPNDDIDIDLSFSSPSNSFKDIISLIPAVYKNNFSDLETSGEMSLVGKVKGKLTEELIPTFDINLNIKNGKFKYPDLPTPINDVNLSMSVVNNDGKINSTVIDFRNFHFEIDQEPVDGSLMIKQPETGPIVNGSIKGKIDLANLHKSITLDGIEELSGVINSNMEFSGNLGNAEEDFSSINARGNLVVKGVKYKAKDMPQEVNISTAQLKFNPKNVALDSFVAKLGESDISASGYLNNLIPFVLSDSKLNGRLSINSNYFDLNPFITSETTEQSKDNKSVGSAKNKESFNVPGNIEFELQSKFDKLKYDNLDLTDVTGKIIIKDSKVNLSGLNMNLLNGKLSGSGYYAKKENQENPEIKFNLNINNFDIGQSFEKFVSVQQFAPIAKYIKGSFSTNFSMNTSLDNEMMPIWETFFSNGLINLASAEISEFKPLSLVSSALNMKELENPKLTNVKPKFEIKNGRFYLKPLKLNLAGYNVNLVGSNGIDQSVDYNMEIEIPAKKLQQQVNTKINSLFGKDVNALKSGTVKVNAKITGTVDNPKVATSAGSVVSNIVDDVKDQIVSEAKAKVDSAKIKAEQKLKQEAKKKEEELKKKLEDEAKKKLKKLFKWG